MARHSWKLARLSYSGHGALKPQEAIDSPMPFMSNDWKARLSRNIDDLQAPAGVSTLMWIALLICAAALLDWYMR